MKKNDRKAKMAWERFTEAMAAACAHFEEHGGSFEDIRDVAGKVLCSAAIRDGLSREEMLNELTGVFDEVWVLVTQINAERKIDAS